MRGVWARDQLAAGGAERAGAAIKRARGKLRSVPGWARALTRLDFEPLPVTAPHAERVERLPWHHRDPFDRLLLAQAELESHALVTADAQLAVYDVEIVW